MGPDVESESPAVRGQDLGRGTGHVSSEMLDKNVAQVFARIIFPSETDSVKQLVGSKWRNSGNRVQESLLLVPERLRHINPVELTLTARIKETTCNVLISEI